MAKNKLVDTVGHFVRKQQLLTDEGLHLVAVSGGADSVALLLVLQQLGYRVEAVHCNFNLRGDESRRDEHFVRELCEREGIPFHVTHFDTTTYAILHQVSVEMAARQLRYHYFSQLRHDIGAETVCVAHHRDDAVETLLMNLIRGTGIHGLTGIRSRNGHVVRPLLCVSRSQILDYLAQRGQSFVTDSTNLQDDALRNKLRLNVIPLLCSTWPGADAAIARTAHLLAEAEKVYNNAIDTTLSQFSSFDKEGAGLFSLPLQFFLSQPSPECLLYELLTPYGFTSAQCQQLSSSLEAPVTGKRYLSATHQLVVDRNRLLLAPLAPTLPTMRIPEPGTYIYPQGMKLTVATVAGSHISKQPNYATFDAARTPFPLTVRPVTAGDRFQPFGMKGSKLVSDYLTDIKQPLPDRQQQLVITDAHGIIIWLAGLRTSRVSAVTPDTQETLTISITTP